MRLRHAVVAALLLSPRALYAQFGTIEELAKRVTDLGFFISYGGFAPSSKDLAAGHRKSTGDAGLLTYGAEFAFQVGEIRRPICAKPDSAAAARGEVPDEPCVKGRTLVDGNMVPTSSVARKCTYDLKELRIRKDAAGRVDTVRVEGSTEKCQPAKDTLLWVLELGFSYGQTTHFHSGVPNLGLTGALKEAPGVAIYATYQPPLVSPYFGFRTGLIKLDDLALTSDALTFTAAPQSVQIGGVVGAVTDLLPGPSRGHGVKAYKVPFNVFVEAGYMYRAFPSVRWSPPSSVPAATPPATAPRRLNMSGWSLGFGVQIEVNDPNKKE